jgi:hypothetical protein
MQNVSSIQCYLWDISLLYAQRRDNIELAKQISRLRVSCRPTPTERFTHAYLLAMRGGPQAIIQLCHSDCSEQHGSEYCYAYAHEAGLTYSSSAANPACNCHWHCP